VAVDADRLSWETDAISVKFPLRRDAFLDLVDSYPIRFALLRGQRSITPDFIRTIFRPRHDCAPDLYERRRRHGETSGDAP
jgi:hypothetical protein